MRQLKLSRKQETFGRPWYEYGEIPSLVRDQLAKQGNIYALQTRLQQSRIGRPRPSLLAATPEVLRSTRKDGQLRFSAWRPDSERRCEADGRGWETESSIYTRDREIASRSSGGQ